MVWCPQKKKLKERTNLLLPLGLRRSWLLIFFFFFTILMSQWNEDSLLLLVGFLQDRVLKCVELMKDLLLINGSANANVAAPPSASSVPQSPIGVLDAACLSYKSDEITVGSCANSSHTSPDTKRRKQDKPSQVDFKSWDLSFLPFTPF